MERVECRISGALRVTLWCKEKLLTGEDYRWCGDFIAMLGEKLQVRASVRCSYHNVDDVTSCGSLMPLLSAVRFVQLRLDFENF